jgi:hypothetical protein
MRDYNFLKNKFIEKHKIDDFIYLERYIKLILEYQLGEYDKYTEKPQENKEEELIFFGTI